MAVGEVFRLGGHDTIQYCDARTVALAFCFFSFGFLVFTLFTLHLALTTSRHFINTAQCSTQKVGSC
jgi:hypothetical protein